MLEGVSMVALMVDGLPIDITDSVGIEHRGELTDRCTSHQGRIGRRPGPPGCGRVQS
jgi:hypothetical protein